MSESDVTTDPSQVIPDVREHEQLLESFLAFEKNFQRDYFPLWLGTMIGPALLGFAALGVIYITRGAEFCGFVIAAVIPALLFLGRFAIVTPFPGLTALDLYWIVTFQDVMFAFFFAFHVGFMFRVPWIGPKIAALSSDSEFILAHQPWMKRMTFLGLLAFIAFPLASTGSAGGAIFGRLLGLSRWAIFWGSTIGAILGNGAMLLLATVVKDSLPQNMQDTWYIKYGGLPIIIGIIVLLERRYTSMKKAFEAQKKQERAAVMAAAANEVAV